MAASEDLGSIRSGSEEEPRPQPSVSGDCNSVGNRRLEFQGKQ